MVVFGPSLGTDLRLFDAQATALGGEYRVIRHDLRGHGRSEVPPGPYLIRELVLSGKVGGAPCSSDATFMRADRVRRA